MKITLVTFLWSAEMLRPFMQHYSALGITHFWIIVHERPDRPELYAQVQTMVEDYDNVKLTSVTGDWIGVQDKFLPALQEQPEEWFTVVDQDEFHLFPERLDLLVHECEKHGFDYVQGGFVDRIAADGSFCNYDPQIGLWQQYPVGAFLTYPICGANFRKIVLSRGRIGFTNNGHHDAKNGIAFPPNRLFVEVHHFKWTGHVVGYLGTRSTNHQKLASIVRREADRFLAYCRAAGNRIDLSEPALMAGVCNPYYPHWSVVVQMNLIGEFRTKIDSLV